MGFVYETGSSRRSVLDAAWHQRLLMGFVYETVVPGLGMSAARGYQRLLMGFVYETWESRDGCVVYEMVSTPAHGLCL
jgi:hypothetical protein